ncbi:DUF4278 domain-containing protein [Phormidium sp. CCY1219]|uniref:DUF4278 domain-containing protein n=1 Tax=Phormidium sp. CCY1219 TaxID=2886104 RepID=UPI002D1F4E5A|nr:DUF4278 domain-containing protein [Phormidium sp. CCY1219]MEB3831092.1 DUF4278 domain-containing protein [Phormidium sp. CCY1219]
MSLSYRGIQYQPSNVPAIQPSSIANYRGVSYYTQSKPQIATPPAVTLMYRGVAYQMNPETTQSPKTIELTSLSLTLV